MLIALLVIVGSIIVWQLMLKPSNFRNWSPDQDTLPSAEINGSLVTIHNIRNFTYQSTTNYTPSYYDNSFDLNKIKQIWYIVEPFASYGAAHTFLSFEFEGNKFVSISVEIRKEKGEKFSPIKGLFKQFELMYVVADEQDVVKLRSNYRKDKVYVYPIKSTKEGAQNVFMSMVQSMNSLHDKPEFYNTLLNNCTTKIAKHVNKVSPGHIPWNYSFVLPSNSDRHAFNLGLIETTETDFEKVRSSHQINTLAEKYADDENFSLKIRGR